jgi:hypothetical protein
MEDNKLVRKISKDDNYVNENKTDIVINNFKKNLLNEGGKVLKKNKFFNDLEDIMSNCEFKKFYDEYFKNFNDIKVILLYMKLYETIQKEYFEKNNKEIEKELLAYIIKNLMMDNITRKAIFKSFNTFTDEKSIINNYSILDIFENINLKIENNKKY